MTTWAAGQIRGLEKVGGFAGKAPTLAEGLLYSGDPQEYKKALARAATLTPEEVRAVTAKWLSRPAFTLRIEPGTRREGGESRAGFFTASEGDGGMQPAFYAHPLFGAAGASSAAMPDRSKLPDVGELKPLDFPEIERATLSNGMELYFARRDAVPVVSARVSFDAGYSADPKDKLGIQSMMLQLMDEGTTRLDSNQLAIAKERLGANISGFADADTTSFGLDAVTPNLAASFELLAEYIRHPAFAQAELERVRAQQLNRIQNELNTPAAIAQRALAPTLFGDAHPYGIPPSGTGEPSVVEKLTRDEIVAFHQTWLRPEGARIFVVGDTTLDEAKQMLEQSFGDWRASAAQPPAKDFNKPIPAPKPRIILINRPASPQSIIFGGRVLPQKGTDDLVDLNAANEVFGGSFLSRINMNLRETKGWSYGVRSMVNAPLDRSSFLVYAPVQADRTGDSIAELRKDLAAFTSENGVTATELARTINGNIRELPGRFETSQDILGGIVSIVTYDRPDDYYETLADKYRNMTSEQLDAEARAAFVGSDLVYVVVGDAEVVAPQLEQLGLPVEIRGVDTDVSSAD